MLWVGGACGHSTVLVSYLPPLYPRCELGLASSGESSIRQSSELLGRRTPPLYAIFVLLLACVCVWGGCICECVCVCVGVGVGVCVCGCVETEHSHVLKPNFMCAVHMEK